MEEGIFDVGGLVKQLNGLTPAEKAIRRASFYRILGGNRSSVGELSSQTGLTAEQLQKYIENLTRQGMLVLDENGFIVGSYGLSLTATEHVLHINGRELFTWCALDAVGIPAALGLDAKIISKCYQCNEPIEITMLGGEVQHSNRENARIWVVEADIGRSIVGCT